LSALILCAVGLVVAFPPPAAHACWTTIFAECFNQPPPNWPWGNWHVAPPSPRWGVHSGNYFDLLLCPNDDRSLWCYGYPLSHDPEFDDYPANYDTYAVWGPFSLSNAAAAQCAFRLWNRSEVAHDSIFWGAATSANLTNALMKISGHQSYETPNGWESRTMDLSNLRDFLSGDSVSMIGLPTVYVFWRFRSDGNSVRDVGSFIDNIVIAVDDGQMNLIARELTLLSPDSLQVTNPVLGDTLRLRWGWTVCTGGVGEYDPFRVMVTLNDSVMADTTVTGAQSGDDVTLVSEPWIVTTPGEYLVRVKVDTLNAIPESNENDNADTLGFSVFYNPPPTFYWITPGTDTLFADSTVTLRWFLSDPDEPAWVSLYYGVSPVSCTGTGIPGGANRPSLNGADSLVWDVRLLPNFHTYYLFAQVVDSSNNTCVYATGLLYVCHGCLSADGRHVSIPEAYFLAQNFPNPFNPATEIRYGIAVPGHVTLRVFNLLGQEQVTLVNGELSPGMYSATFDGSRFTSGLYVYVLTTPEGTLRQKMMLLR
jgi:hypothetical protein